MDNNFPLYLFHQGTNYQAYKYFGCHRVEQSDDWVFRVYAPHAKSVSVVGDFNGWNVSASPMKKLAGGTWEVVISGVKLFDAYKFCITKPDGNNVLKADPYAFHSETNGATASKVYSLDGYDWQDGDYLKKKRKTSVYEKPINIYEVHLGSWRRHADGNVLSYADLADQLVDYVYDMGYTHIELMPIAEFPFDGSWGYQVTGYYSITSRFGTPHDFMYFVDKCHQKGIGVIVDWVPAHFPRDEHGLASFDGTKLYEHDTLEHKSWGTLTFDYSKNEVKSFLISNAMFMHDIYHVDGLRVDAVASMLYLDYDRRGGEWRPNKYGGNYNLEAIAFLQDMNKTVLSRFPRAFTVAEESTAFPMVTMPPSSGGLGFNFKWNMGWMNDILDYVATDPFFRKGNHNKLTFGISYAFSENYILPFSHDEVVHGKCSMLSKLPGDYKEKFRALKALYAYQYAHPGKKLNFMGNEIAQFIEWNFERPLDWFLLDYSSHRGVQSFVRKLNEVYKKYPALYELDNSYDGFKWLVVDDNVQNVVAFYREASNGDRVVAIVNFSEVTRNNYTFGVPDKGRYRVILNSNDRAFEGDTAIKSVYRTKQKPSHGFKQSLTIDLEGNTALYLVVKKP